MRTGRRATLALGAALALLAGPVIVTSARADDALVLPPELRPGASAPSLPAVPAAKRAAKPSAKSKASAKGSSAGVAPPAAASGGVQSSALAAPPSVAAPRQKAEDEPLSFGLKWNADNQPNRGAATTDGLIEDYNKNLNNQSVGSGGAVGFKYKF